MQPRAERCFTTEPAQRAQGAHERLLREILGLGVASHVAPQETTDLAPVPLNELGERRAIARQESMNGLGVDVSSGGGHLPMITSGRAAAPSLHSSGQRSILAAVRKARPRRPNVLGALAAVFVLLALAAPRAKGQTAERAAQQAPGDEARRLAREEFAQGKTAFEAGDYLRAAALFESAYRHAPHHDALWNAARALELAGEKAQAANLYTQYLTAAPPDARDRDRATASRRALSEALGRIEIQGAVQAPRVDGAPVDSLTVFVDPGEHIVRARVDGADVERVIQVAAGAAASVVLGRASGAAPAQSVGAAAQPTGAPLAPPSPARPPNGRPLSPAFFYVGLGLTAVAAGLTIASGVDTLNAKASFDTLPSGAALDSGTFKQDRTNVLFWTTVGVGVITGASAIFFVDFRGRETAARVGVGPGGAWARGAF